MPTRNGLQLFTLCVPKASLSAAPNSGMPETESSGTRRGITGLPLDVLAGPCLLGSCRLAQLALVACVSHRLREAAAAAAARHTTVSISGPYDEEDAVALLAKLPSLQALDLSSAQILRSHFLSETKYNWH